MKAVIRCRVVETQDPPGLSAGGYQGCCDRERGCKAENTGLSLVGAPEQ